LAVPLERYRYQVVVRARLLLVAGLRLPLAPPYLGLVVTLFCLEVRRALDGVVQLSFRQAQVLTCDRVAHAFTRLMVSWAVGMLMSSAVSQLEVALVGW
jgi:hypothetical protein